MAAKGTSPADCSPLTCHVGDHSYEVSVEVELSQQAVGGLLLFYNRASYMGLAYDGSRVALYRYGSQGRGGGPANTNADQPPTVRSMFLKIQNDRHIVTCFRSEDGVNWTRQDPRSETSGIHNNALGGELSLRPALFASGRGEVTFRQFTFRAL